MKWSINDALFFSLIHQLQPQFWHFLSFFCASFPSTIAVGGISQPVLNHFFNIGLCCMRTKSVFPTVSVRDV